jgi:NADH-quinone oxidoreductase subunit J
MPTPPLRPEVTMIEALLANLETLLLWIFGVSALVGGVLVVVLRQPMRVALALISTMVFLGGIYGLLGVHFIAAFQVLIYVGAVMVFMVYVIMLLDTRDTAYRRRFSNLLVPGVIAFVLFLGALIWGVSSDGPVAASASAPGTTFSLAEFSSAFLNQYWLHFELTSVLLVAAVVAAVAIIKVSRGEHG